jgi:hypothetical protein
MRATREKIVAREEAVLAIAIQLTKIFHSVLFANKEEQIQKTRYAEFVQGKDNDSFSR